MSSTPNVLFPALSATLGLLAACAHAASGYVPGEVLVRYQGPVSSNVISSIAAKPPRRQLGGGFERIVLKQGITVEEAIARLGAAPGVVYAQPNYVKRSQAIPNDPRFNLQWALKNDGQAVPSSSGSDVSGFTDADIDANVAWDATTGDPSVVVAIIDSGIDYSHPDLTGNVWQNPNETKNGLDDDGNGYVDDVMGWDFVHNDNDPVDLNGHGTHVAGIIAAQGNDGSTVAGVSWRTTLMPLQVVDADGITTSSAIVSAIRYAVDNGAKVINASYGETTFDQAEYDAIAYANGKGVLVVAAACNNGVDNDTAPCYPSSYDLPNIIAVAASDQFDNRASFSSWGAVSVDLAAPGVSIISTYPQFDRLGNTAFVNGVQGWTFGGSPDQWGVSGGLLQDSPSGNYANNANNWAMSPVIDLSGRSGCRVVATFSAISLENNIDTLIVEGSNDGSTWSAIGELRSAAQLAGSDFYADASAFDNANPFYFRFRLQSNGSVVSDGVAISNAGVDCYGVHDQNAYAFLDGTSVAAPFVSGTAALILAQSSGLTVSEVRNRILNNVDQKATLTGLVASGGRLNAAKALGLTADNNSGGPSGGGGGVSPGLLVMLAGLIVRRSRKKAARARRPVCK